MTCPPTLTTSAWPLPSKGRVSSGESKLLTSSPAMRIPPLPVWLGGADRRAHGAELRGIAPRVLERRAGVRVDELALPDVRVSPRDHLRRDQQVGARAAAQVDDGLPGLEAPEHEVVGHAGKAVHGAVGHAGELGLGIAELLRPRAAGREDELPFLLDRDLGVGLLDLAAQDVDVDRRFDLAHVVMGSVRRWRRSHQASASDGMQRFVAVTVVQAPTSTPPRTSAAVPAPAANSAATVASQTVASLNACRRRVGFGGSGGP